MKTIILILLFAFLVRFIIRFVLPIVRVTRSATKTFRQMQEQMNNPQQRRPSTQGAQESLNYTSTYKSNSPRKGDYIDFEEVK